MPIVNARPDVSSLKLSELDEFLIIANNGLWDFVSYQTAVDIARSERNDPMIAAQKLRDFAISYGSEGTTMIMVISVAGMFSPRGQEKDNPLQDVELFFTTTQEPQKTKSGTMRPADWTLRSRHPLDRSCSLSRTL